MLKSPIKTCEVTGKRMPASFLIRFVASKEKYREKEKFYYRPNFSHQDKFLKYAYCYCHPKAIEIFKQSQKLGLYFDSQLQLELKRTIFTHLYQLFEYNLLIFEPEKAKTCSYQLTNEEQSNSKFKLKRVITNQELSYFVIKKQQQIIGQIYDILLQLNKVRNNPELFMNHIKLIGQLPQISILELRFEEMLDEKNKKFLIVTKEEGIKQEQMNKIAQAAQYYKGKYYQESQVTIEKQMYSLMDQLTPFEELITLLSNEESVYTLGIKPSKQTNYLYQFLFKYNKIYNY